MVERRCVLSPLQKYVFHSRQVVLETIINTGEQSRSEGNLEHFAFEFHQVTVFQASGTLKYLNRNVLAFYLDDLVDPVSEIPFSDRVKESDKETFIGLFDKALGNKDEGARGTVIGLRLLMTEF